MPAGIRDSHRELHLRTRDGLARVRVRRIAERSADIELLEIDPA
jgi:hypothetical protein